MVRRQAAKRAQGGSSVLALHEVAERAAALLKDRERLLRDVNKRKQQLEQVRAGAERDRHAAVSKLAPLVERHEALVRELTALFDELLAEGRLSARARREVLKVRSSLSLLGFLSSVADGDESEARARAADPWDDEPGEPWPEQPGRRGRAGQGAKAGGREASAREVASAPQPAEERRTLRDIFRSLARAVHPDLARQESERERRTELMKEATRAYETGDLARLIELENDWQNERALNGEGDSEARCRELERINRELLNQVRQLTRELRDAKRDAREASFGSLDAMTEQASRELNGFASICEFVRRFRDGRITLTEFTRGPWIAHETDDLELVLAGMFAGFHDEPEPPRRRSRGQRRS